MENNANLWEGPACHIVLRAHEQAHGSWDRAAMFICESGRVFWSTCHFWLFRYKKKNKSHSYSFPPGRGGEGKSADRALRLTQGSLLQDKGPENAPPPASPQAEVLTDTSGHWGGWGGGKGRKRHFSLRNRHKGKALKWVP